MRSSQSAVALTFAVTTLVACARQSEGAANDAVTKQMTELKKTADSVVAVATARLRHDVDSLMAARTDAERRLEAIAESQAQAIRGLPGSISLDSVNSYYAARWSEAGFTESFETAAGAISFWKSNFTFAYVPSTRDVAYIRIGKDGDGATAREVIRAWLGEAAELKMRLGYTRAYQRSGPTQYGDYSESLYRKGDSYFKTYFRQSRVQGTYGRHSMEYDYFVEFGSTARADRYKLETLNSRIGS